MNVAIIGAGALGRSFALACARAGLPVVLEDVMPDKLRQAGVEFASLGHAVRLVSTVEDAVADADIVIDFVPDDLESKLEIWSLLDRMAPPRTILCTPSEILSITDLASCTYRADRCIMARGPLTGPLQLLTARQTSAATLDHATRLFTAIGCTLTSLPDPDLPQLLKNMHATIL
jgi:3-hydroxybutyryl-CoA dehydrogenase